METTKNTNHDKLFKFLQRTQVIDAESLERAVYHHLEYTVGKFVQNIGNADIFLALAYSIRDILTHRFNITRRSIREKNAKRVYYLSMEFLIGKLLEANLINMNLRTEADKALNEFGYDLDTICNYEPDAGLGNGGLGRLAACFLDSMASLNYPCSGYGLRYEFGLFHQLIINGRQEEAPDNWLAHGNPWETHRMDLSYPIYFYGRVSHSSSKNPLEPARWIDCDPVRAVAYDIMVPGYNNDFVSNLRLWSALATQEFNLDYFNHGDYIRAVEDKRRSEKITKVLYPDDSTFQGHELRLKQEYLLVSATIQDAIRIFLRQNSDWNDFPKKVLFQLNDTHPALCVAELMSLLIDKYKLGWENAWDITRNSIAYTNHTMMPEALEKWSLDLFGPMFPRHLEIIQSINHLFISDLREKGISDEAISNVSIIEESTPKRIRMANLAVIGSKSVNGVSKFHSELVKNDLFPDFNNIWPEKFQNKTNGITQRRWLLQSNPQLSDLISEALGDSWISDFKKIKDLINFADDSEYQKKWDKVQYQKKESFSKVIQFECGVSVDPNSIFDIHIKRIHEYKRQLLNVMRIIHDYFYIQENPDADYSPRTFIFAGKAAPAYHRAHLIIKLINDIAEVINTDKSLNNKIKVAFIPNFAVSLAQMMYPAADLSEQISTAGTEASGTGNMKFMMNGALTVGTLDGANIEMLEAVGKENIYIFGKTIEELEELKNNKYDPQSIYQNDKDIKRILDSIRNNFFNKNSPGIFDEIFRSLVYEGDIYDNFADFHSYIEVQKQISIDFRDRTGWAKKSIINTAHSSVFSSDRTIQDYVRDIWEVESVNL
jgi:starch phosphorylase